VQDHTGRIFTRTIEAFALVEQEIEPLRRSAFEVLAQDECMPCAVGPNGIECPGLPGRTARQASETVDADFSLERI